MANYTVKLLFYLEMVSQSKQNPLYPMGDQPTNSPYNINTMIQTDNENSEIIS